VSTDIINAMSVDVEDYFQVSAFDEIVPRAGWSGLESRVVANTERLLEGFDRAGVKATFFFLGCVAERFPALVRRVAAASHEIASHGYNHQLVYSLSPQLFREDVRAAKMLLEDLIGDRVRGYRAPSYSVTRASLWALDVLIEEGYDYDTSIFPIHHDRYGIADAPRHAHLRHRPSGTIVEMPASTVRVARVNLPIAGGAYFRLLPYEWARWGIDRVNTVEQKPVVFYLHPWEVDPEQPRFQVSASRRIRHYTGLKATLGRLTRLLRRFQFNTVSSVLERSDVGSSLVTAQHRHLAALSPACRS
jgi:polysaccharide deacetylase family protein (PEP-CTERM system associated)